MLIKWSQAAARDTLRLSCLTNFVADSEFRSVDHMAWMLNEIVNSDWHAKQVEIHHWLGWAQAGLVMHYVMTRKQIEQINSKAHA